MVLGQSAAAPNYSHNHCAKTGQEEKTIMNSGFKIKKNRDVCDTLYKFSTTEMYPIVLHNVISRLFYFGFLPKPDAILQERANIFYHNESS
jgi:hypothetical protein